MLVPQGEWANIVQSIKQKPERPAARHRLPDFRNLGVMLRTLLLVNLLALVTVFIGESELPEIVSDLIVMAGRVEPPLFLTVLVLYLGRPWLRRLPWRGGVATIGVVVATVVIVSFPLLAVSDTDSLPRWLAWAGGATLVCLMYFDYQGRRYSPALTEARLMALTSRIRPHFLFNSLNGVLGVIRSDPRRAERALEELADLFRALMRDNRELVPLADEVHLCRRYVDIEYLRLGDRLRVNWDLDEAADEAQVPPLMLQPLLENAIYHGVELSSEQAEVHVRIVRSGAEVIITVENPIADAERHHSGNRMALDNIRERLMLFFDLEARLEAGDAGGRYRVTIRLPYGRGKT